MAVNNEQTELNMRCLLDRDKMEKKLKVGSGDDPVEQQGVQPRCSEILLSRFCQSYLMRKSVNQSVINTFLSVGW